MAKSSGSSQSKFEKIVWWIVLILIIVPIVLLPLLQVLIN